MPGGLVLQLIKMTGSGSAKQGRSPIQRQHSSYQKSVFYET
jgi:hypothetical protein